MKIYSNILEQCDVEEAFNWARQKGQDIYIDEIRSFKSSKANYGIEVYAYSQKGKRRSAHISRGNVSPLMAVSWSAYGYVIARLFDSDPDAIIGQYKDATDFRKQVRSQHAFARRNEDIRFINYC